MFYHRDSGLLHGNHFITSDPALVALNTPADHVPIEVVDGRRFDHLAQRVNVEGLAGEATAEHIVDYIPPQPAPTHDWNAATKRWGLRKALLEAKRDRAAAVARIRELQDGQHTHMRRLALDPKDAAARAALEQIEAEVTALGAAAAPADSLVS